MTVGDGGRFCALSAVATVLCAACAWAAGPEKAGSIDWANRAEEPPCLMATKWRLLK